MKILLIFDEDIPLSDLSSVVPKTVGEIDLFPLTSNFGVIDQCEQMLKSLGIESLQLINTAERLEDSVGELRDRIQVWSHEFANAKIKESPVRDIFNIDKKVSTYWFSLIAEKNPLKSDVFLKICQYNAIESIFTSRHYSDIIISITDHSLNKSIKRISGKKNLNIKDITHRKKRVVIQQFFLRNGFIPGAIVQAFGFLFRAFLWSIYSKVVLGAYGKDDAFTEKPLIISYFPYIEKESAEKGIFINNYFKPLQHKLARMDIIPSWLLIFVFIDGFTFRKAVKKAKIFADNGARLRFLDQAFNISILFQVTMTWVHQFLLFIKYKNMLSSLEVHERICSKYAVPIMNEIICKSFCGVSAMQGIYYYFLFREIAKGLKKTENVIYLCEMQTWEKALNAATSRYAPGVTRIGYQHTSISKNYYHYFIDPAAVKTGIKKKDLPLPDIIAVNGKKSYKMLQPCHYPRLEIVEALRQMDLVPDLSLTQINKTSPPVLLVAGSYDLREACALVSIVMQARNRMKNISVWMKGHPSCPMEKVCQKLNIDPEKHGIRIVYGDINSHLKSATMVLVATSTVAIDALAFGCQVIVPFFSDVLNMTPIYGNKNFYHSITGSEDLLDVMQRLNQRRDDYALSKGQSFISDYWCMNPQLPKWEKLLNETCVANQN